jgi:hypothetical protein
MIKIIKDKLTVFFQHKFSFPAFLFLTTFLTYGLMSPWLRFFHDEYSILLFSERMQNASQFFTGNRPFLGYVYQPFLFLFGSNYFLWFIFGITMRWLHALCLMGLIKEIWGDHQHFAIVASLLCIIFPAFQAQFAFMIFGILFLLFSFFLLSLTFSIKALKNKQMKFLFVFIALGLSLISLTTTEYFFTLEILRYLIFGFLFYKENKQNWLKRLLTESIPYLLLFISASIWRYSQQSAETTYAFNSNSILSAITLQSVLDFLQRLIIDIWEVSFGSWVYAFYPSHLLENVSLKVLLIFFLISVFTGIISILMLRFTKQHRSFSKQDHIFILSFASISIICAGFPFWIANLPIGGQYMYSRWAIPFMIGVSVFFTWLFHCGKNSNFRYSLIAFLIALGVGYQLIIANSFRHDLEKQLSYYWQFKWRIPALEKDTTIFSNMLDFKYENSDEVSGALNFFYPNHDNQTITLFQFYLPERVGTALLPEIQPNFPISGRRYYDAFKSNSSQAILVDFQYPACVKVLDPEIDSLNPSIDDLSREALVLADNSLIKHDSQPIDTKLVRNIFGKQPDQDWCYFFAKADLARQFRKWGEIASISEIVETSGFTPRDQREWFPFIEGYAHNGEWEKAFVISNTIFEESPQYSQMLHALWGRINRQTDDSKTKANIINSIRHIVNDQ